MSNSSTVTTVGSIFLLLLAGYSAKKLNALSRKDTPIITSVIINLTMPAFIFVSVHGRPLTASMVKVPFLIFGVEMAVMGMAYFLARSVLKLDRPTTGGFLLAAAFGNTGFLGYPVVTAAFPGSHEALISAVMLDQFGMQLILCTLGLAIASSFSDSSFEWKSAAAFLRGPMFASAVISLVLRKVEIHPMIMNSLTYLGAATVPLAMISIGLNLGTDSVRDYPAALIAVLVLKMLLIPAIVYAMLPVIGVGGIVAKVAVLLASMPSAVFTGVIAGRYGANGRFVAGTIFVTTLASIIWVPVVLALL